MATRNKNARRHRAVTFKEGQKARIADLFIRSMLHNRPQDESPEQFMERFFNVGKRHLFFVRANKEFALGGKVIPEGAKLLVRRDQRDTYYEMAPLSDCDFVTELTSAEFRIISSNLRWDDDSDLPPTSVLQNVRVLSVVSTKGSN